jgi:hypothetical protein
MAKIYGQLERAQLENRTTDLSPAVAGLAWWNTATGKPMLDDGTLVAAILRNDSKLILGNSAAPADNVRLHRGAAGALQVVKATDTTAEGTLAATASIAQVDKRVLNLTQATLPGFGSPGRLAWLTDVKTIMVDSGTAWLPAGQGGGGGSLSWVEDATSPISSVEFGLQVYSFAAGEGQSLFALVRVPSGYTTGMPITLRLTAYSPGATGNVNIKTVTTLIRPGTDAVDSTGNQNTSTNGVITLSAGTVQIPQAITFDLSNSTGQVNGASVAGGDLLKVELKRLTALDTATADLKVLVYGAETKFST